MFVSETIAYFAALFILLSMVGYFAVTAATAIRSDIRSGFGFRSSPSARHSQAGSSSARPFYIIVMCALTGVYLLVELAFNARLLDVVGGMASEEEIDRIELWGRAISGVALALAVWGMVIFPRYYRKPEVERNRGSLYAALAISGVLSLVVMYHVQEFIIDTIVESSSAEQRYAATRLLLLTDATHQQMVDIANIDLSPEAISTPEGKSFLALFPTMGLTVDRLDERTQSATEQIVRNLVITEIGSSAEIFNEAYVPSVRELHEVYLEYAEGSNVMLEALERIPHEQNRLWNSYGDSLRGIGYRHFTVPRSLWSRVRNDVQRSGVPVPNDWNPNDQAGFNRAIAEEIEGSALNSFRNAMYRTGEFDRINRPPPPPGLTFENFTAHGPIQSKWASEMQVDHLNIHLAPNYDHGAFRSLVWEPMIRHETAEQMEVFRANLQDFEEGGRFAEEGQLAMKALAVPPVALLFSLLGALVHVFKLSNYLLWVALPGWQSRGIVVGATCLVLAAIPATKVNAITTSNLYEAFRANTAESFSPLFSDGITWIIQAQPYAYPVNEFIRTTVLLGYGFGYEGGSIIEDATQELILPGVNG